MSRTLGQVASRLLPHAALFAFGLVLLGYATASYGAFAYMRATPSTGTVSTPAGFELFTLVIFVAGAMVAFLAAGAALYRILEDTR